MKQRKTRLIALLSILFISTSGFSQNPSTTAKINPGHKTEGPAKTAAARPVTPELIEGQLKEALALIEGNYVDGKKLNYNDVFKSSIGSMLETLDPHSRYFDAKEFAQFMTDQSSKYFGIGATIGDLSDADGNVQATYIKATFEGAPAWKAGLRYGDKILEVNGASMLGKPFSEVRTFLRGPQGTAAKIVVERLATGKRETVDIIRDAVPQPSISEVYMIRPGIGYMAMRGGFNQTTSGEFVRGLRELKAAGMQQLILDLRDNPGGLVIEAVKVANTFLSSGQRIITQKGRVEGANEIYDAENRNPDRSPVVMLVNGGTASASEIFAGSMQDHDRALIVGETTFGKGLVTMPIQLDYRSMLLLTIAKYETPSGRQVQRDYSNGDIYSYIHEGGSLRDENAEAAKPKGRESKTDTGRTIYSGGGINPDVVIKPQTITFQQFNFETRLANPIFAFSLDLVMGRVKGFETYKVDKPIAFDYDLKATDFPVTDALYQTFKKYAGDNFKFTAAQVDSEREYVERTLRTELVTAAYGSQTSGQVFNEYDKQLLKAVELLPQAKQLAMQSEKVHSTAGKQPGRDNQ